MCVWDVPGKRLLLRLEGHAAPVRSLRVAGAVVFSGGQDAWLRTWSLETGPPPRASRALRPHSGCAGPC